MIINYKLQAIQNLVPNCSLAWKGEDWEGLEWLDERPCPTKEEWENEKARLIAQQPLNNCKTKAKQLLSDSDWSEIPSVIEQLENFNEWKEYRMNIRKFIINPIENPVFPDKPETIWKVV